MRTNSTASLRNNIIHLSARARTFDNNHNCIYLYVYIHSTGRRKIVISFPAQNDGIPRNSRFFPSMALLLRTVDIMMMRGLVMSGRKMLLLVYIPGRKRAIQKSSTLPFMRKAILIGMTIKLGYFFHLNIIVPRKFEIFISSRYIYAILLALMRKV